MEKKRKEERRKKRIREETMKNHMEIEKTQSYTYILSCLWP